MQQINEAFTPREREVLRLILEGLTNKQIGKRLDVAERTVKFHVSNLLAKTGKDSRMSLLAGAARELSERFSVLELGRPL